jgi:hypothetical protein
MKCGIRPSPPHVQKNGVAALASRALALRRSLGGSMPAFAEGVKKGRGRSFECQRSEGQAGPTARRPRVPVWAELATSRAFFAITAAPLLPSPTRPHERPDDIDDVVVTRGGRVFPVPVDTKPDL